MSQRVVTKLRELRGKVGAANDLLLAADSVSAIYNQKFVQISIDVNNFNRKISID